MFAKPIVKKNQPNVDHVTGNKVPKSFVFSTGKLPAPLKHLQIDLRKVMLPYTALNLKEKKRTNLKDFLNVAGPMGFSSGEQHLKLITIMFQNIFPAIDINTVKLTSCQRIVLLNYNKDTKLVDFRHYSITLQPVVVSRRIRKFVQNHQVPDLRGLQDVSDFINRAGYGSESEADEEAATVTLPGDIGRVNKASTKSAVKLQEIGPRMTLKLVKIEEGLCSGGFIFSEYGYTSDSKEEEGGDILENNDENQNGVEEDEGNEEDDEDLDDVKENDREGNGTD